MNGRKILKGILITAGVLALGYVLMIAAVLALLSGVELG
jgi:hypothetical protein